MKSKLKVGERGYWRHLGKCYPARVLANDVMNTFGPIDEIIGWLEFPHMEHISRAVRGCSPYCSDHWVSTKQFKQEERARLTKIAEEAKAGLEALA